MIEQAQKHSKGKVRGYSMIPARALREEALVNMEGAKKYPPHNWRKGIAWSKYLDPLIGHLFDFCEGQDRDPEDDCHLLAKVRFYCGALIEFGETHPELDDRPIQQIKREDNGNLSSDSRHTVPPAR